MVPEGPEAPADGSTLSYPYPRAAPSPARLLQHPRQTYIPECQANPGLQTPPASQKKVAWVTAAQANLPHCQIWSGVGYLPAQTHEGSTRRPRGSERVRGSKPKSQTEATAGQGYALEPLGAGRGLRLGGQVGVSSRLSKCLLEGLMLKLKL